ncbi:PadR family transcriptional regulator [Intrasporangium chromatireducens Q5-1]|uniref:PadR family transcriptional regulator n=1 Tax=Intrasporangium chromatireducens Q5-1 TaxID=584657 RepID=W9GMV2_9MICO|nr:PadR family transcriptional regulator [Intrasporangium chromatireducens]EWT06148.1 PadR family transcriptional regulator [Intrasporangium chromatireducens Q5-1]
MSTERLTTTSYVVLGLIALRGPSTSYDLKRAVGHSVGYFWSFPHAQLYSEPRRLSEMGLLEVATELDGRRRQTFSVTDQGSQALRRWLAEPVTEPMQVRDVAELKLFFSELSSGKDVLTMAKEQVRQHSDRIRVYEDMEERYGAVDRLAPRLVSLRLGLRLEHAALDFWTELVGELSNASGSGQARDAS